MMAWLGTALKSSQPSRNARRRSDRPMIRITGPAAPSCAAGTCGVTLPWNDVAMVVISLAAAAQVLQRASGRRWNDRDFWPNAKAGPAISRTWQGPYSQTRLVALTA